MIRKVYIICILIAIPIAYSFLSRNDYSITLHYTINYKGDNWQKNKTGFLWALSYLGASLPEKSFDKSIEWKDSTTFEINFKKLGFSDEGLQAIETIIENLKSSEQYIQTGYFDLSQLIVLTVGSSWHYYAITNVPKTFAEYSKQHHISNTSEFAVTNSAVAKHNRLIKLRPSENILESVFIAVEGNGDFTDHTFQPIAFEVLDVMPNGQLRFAIYDTKGKLIDASPAHASNAGKPSKCIWCHEIVFQPLFLQTDSLEGYMSPAEFQKVISDQNKLLTEYRKKLKSEINFNNTQDHAFMEYQYTSYMEPSIQKLSQEWKMDTLTLKKILDAKPTHDHSEYRFLKNLFSRKEITSSSPFKAVLIPDDVREPGTFEPNYFDRK